MGEIINLFKRMGGKQMPSIYDVANYFVTKGNCEAEDPITPLKLQKLCYYAQAWSMVWDEQELFKEDFQAWVHGPANYNLYIKYNDVSMNSTICRVDEDFNINIFCEKQIETLETVWDAYGKFVGSYLEQLTHQEKPWKQTRGNLPPGMRCDKVIPKYLMHEFYSELNG